MRTCPEVRCFAHDLPVVYKKTLVWISLGGGPNRMGFRWECPKCGSQGFRLEGDQSTTMYGDLVKQLEKHRK